MELIPTSFLQLLDTSSLSLKKAMLIALQSSIRTDENKFKHKLNRHTSDANLSQLIDYFPDIINNKDNLVDGLLTELQSIPLSPGSCHVTSQWISLDMEPYVFWKKTYKSADIKNYPHIQKLLDVVNQHPSTTGNLNSCLINRYDVSNVAGRLHADDEPNICQLSSICTVSLGETREITFRRSDNTPVLKTLTLSDKSAFTMKPGCQQVLKHQLMQGPPGTDLRFSISFRRSIPKPNSISPSPKTSTTVTNTCGSLLILNSPTSPSASPQNMRSISDSTIPPAPAALIMGDSIGARLDPGKIGKNKLKVFNIAQGGLTMNKTEKALDDFFTQADLTSIEVTSVFVSVGTNDIRFCYNGIRHLRAPLNRLISKVRLCFPEAEIYLHSILPIINPKNPFNIQNVYELNDLFFNLCQENKVYYLNFFGDFLNSRGGRNHGLFEDEVHPHKQAMGLIARRYIDLLHTRRGKYFDPLIY